MGESPFGIAGESALASWPPGPDYMTGEQVVVDGGVKAMTGHLLAMKPGATVGDAAVPGKGAP